jgi:hypothetical protein
VTSVGVAGRAAVPRGFVVFRRLGGTDSICLRRHETCNKEKEGDFARSLTEVHFIYFLKERV